MLPWGHFPFMWRVMEPRPRDAILPVKRLKKRCTIVPSVMAVMSPIRRAALYRSRLKLFSGFALRGIGVSFRVGGTLALLNSEDFACV